MSSTQVGSLLEREDVDVLIPLGALEQHGPHLPLGTDTAIADAMARSIAIRAGSIVVTPCLPVGCSDHHLDFPGTASLQEDVVIGYIRSTVLTLLSHGFRYAYIVSGHAGNMPAMEAASTALQTEVAGRVLAFTDWPGQRDLLHQLAESSLGLTRDEVGSHAGHFETSIMMRLAPDSVNTSLLPRGFVGSVGEAAGTMTAHGMAAVSPVGVIGDARRSSAAAGVKYLEVLADSIVSGIRLHRASARGNGGSAA
jgi:creatinine amidohydrolase